MLTNVKSKWRGKLAFCASYLSFIAGGCFCINYCEATYIVLIGIIKKSQHGDDSILG